MMLSKDERVRKYAWVRHMIRLQQQYCCNNTLWLCPMSFVGLVKPKKTQLFEYAQTLETCSCIHNIGEDGGLY